MLKNMARFLLVISLCVVLMECGGVAEGGSGWDKYPERPINLVICYSPGGGSDVMWNLVKPFIERELNATFVPIYKPGANGAVGWTYLVKETQPDGYTIAVGNTPPIVGNPIMSPECQYTMDDIVPIYNIVDDPGILVVAASSPIKTFEDFIKYAKENPGKASVGNSGVGGDDWTATKLIEMATGVQLTAVPFPGDGPSWQAAMGGHITASSNNLSIVYQQIMDGALRPLVLYAEERSEFLPDVPTARELGYDIISGSGRGLVAKRGTPEEALKILEAAFERATKNNPEFLARAKEGGFPLRLLNREEYKKYLDETAKTFEKVWQATQKLR